jgi:hypothetical protein
MKAYELIGRVDEHHQLHVSVPDECAPGEVRVLLLAPEKNGAKNPNETAQPENGWESLTQLIEECQMDTGIEDLAHEHDHYIHGKPKRPT